MAVTRPQRLRATRVAVGLATSVFIGGCGGVPPTPAPTTSQVTPAPPAVATATLRPSVAPTEKPVPTIQATIERAAEPPPGAIEIVMTVVNKPEFQPDEITAPAGTITLFLDNPGVLEEIHDFQIGPELLRAQAKTQAIFPRQRFVLTLTDVPAGTYTFWCSITRHYSFGMVGTLTVTP
jgi:plastocyanin